MNAIVDPDLCISCGLCPAICGEVFKMKEDDLAYAYHQVTDDLIDSATEARDSCPVEAISLED